ncbi:expressed unknown protein [Seminavis robusta]|uniref:Uncharacterized protein n=1 Tax=Seminavis robusta TaxID=568900 RepID=A0A9N8DSM3_9STRA|nr:expressed unknown protein [Seminavis robusta]|eukprot:Sro323_g117180.1 n/a (207) ;mRNA; r:29-743
MMRFSFLLCLALFVGGTTAFQVSTPKVAASHVVPKFFFGSSETALQMSSSNEDQKKKTKGPFDEGLRTKLVSESIAPWRTLRLFLYGSLGSGAAVGGFITLAGTLAALSGARTDVDLNTEYVNLAIDFGAVLAFAVLAKFDLDKGAELEGKVDEKIERKRQQKGVVREMKKREKELQNLDLEIQVSLDGTTKTASVRDLQPGPNNT